MYQLIALLFLLFAPLWSAPLKIHGIVLAEGDSNSVELQEVEGVFFEGISDPAIFESLRAELEERFLNQELTAEIVRSIQQTILAFYDKLDRSFVIVSIPDQNVQNGVVSFTVQPIQAGTVTVSGNRWFNERRLAQEFSIREGEVLQKSQLLNQVAWLNQNPFRHAQLILSPAETGRETDLELRIKDRFPARFYSGVDNTGTEFSGSLRLFAGFNYGDLFGRGDLFTYQFTTSAPVRRFLAHYLNYTSFLRIQHQLILYGGYAESHPAISDFRSEAKNAQGSLRYNIPIKPLYAQVFQQLSFGADYKSLNSNLFFTSDIEEIPIVTHDVSITQLVAGYQFHFTNPTHDTLFKIDCFASPAKWLGSQTTSRYQALRPGSEVRYFYGRIAAGEVLQIGRDWVFSSLLRAQVSSAALLSSEQFGFGGAETVRGYEERIFNADNALCLNVELHSPHLSLFSKKALYFLLFADLGKGWNYDATSGFSQTEPLIGVGPGIRYAINPYFTSRLDYGFQLHSVPGDSSFGRFHFSLVAGY